MVQTQTGAPEIFLNTVHFTFGIWYIKNMLYNPSRQDSQEMLSAALVRMLEDSGFKEEFPRNTMERVYSRYVAENIRVMVYTSIHRLRGVVRRRGQDAIRVCLVRKCADGRERGLARDRRVNRVGQIEAIVERAQGRMRDVWRAARTVRRCNCCEAPTFVSKNGNLVCSDLCWTRI
jgi:hypothetical protein